MRCQNASLRPATWKQVDQQLKPVLRDYYEQAQTQVAQGLEATYQISDTVMLLRGERLKNSTKELVVVGLSGDMATGTLAAVEHAKQHLLRCNSIDFSIASGELRRPLTLCFLNSGNCMLIKSCSLELSKCLSEP